MGDHDYHQTACAYSSSSDDQLIAQLEFYFSQDNLIQDHYLRSQMDDESFVPILTICNFSKVKQFIEGVSDPEQFIATLVQNKSDVLQVDDLGEKIRAQSGPVKYRLVVREVATHFKQKDVMAMFANCEANVLSAEPTGCNSTWYIGFETESDSIAAMDHLKKNYNLKVHMKKIMSGHYQGPSSRPQPASTPGTQGSFHWSGPFTPSPGSSPVQQNCPTWFITTSTPPNQQPSIANYDNLANYGTGNYHIIQRQQNSRGGKRNGPKNAGTMYQPFQRGGYEHGTPHEAHSHHFHTTTNQKFTRKPRVRGSPRPTHAVNGERKDYYRRKADGTSTPDSEKTVSPVIDVPVIPAFELMTQDFPSLGDSPTPPLSNSKQEFDQLKPSKIADVLRTGTSISPEPSLSKDQKPIAPPNVQKTPNPTTDNISTEKTPQPVTTGVTATWVPHRRNLIEAIKERPKPASTNQNRPSVEKSTSSTKKNGSTSGATNGEIEVLSQTRDTQPDENRNVQKRVEKNHQTIMATNDNRDTNNNSEIKNPKPKPNKEESVAKEPKSDSNETTESNQTENDGWSVVKEKPKKMKVESRSSRTERSSFRERRSKEEREQFDSNKPRSNRVDRKERKPKKYENEKTKEESEPVVEPTPTPDIESESFGPSLGNNPFPQSQPLLLQPNMPVSRWADIASK